jgi:hypothetical protein
MAITVDLTPLFKSNNAMGKMNERDVMRKWLAENVGDYAGSVNKGEGWKMSMDARPLANVFWYVAFEDDSCAVMFKLRFS